MGLNRPSEGLSLPAFPGYCKPLRGFSMGTKKNCPKRKSRFPLKYWEIGFSWTTLDRYLVRLPASNKTSTRATGVRTPPRDHRQRCRPVPLSLQVLSRLLYRPAEVPGGNLA